MNVHHLLRSVVICLVFSTVCLVSLAQETRKISVELIGSIAATSRKHFQYNTNEGFYWEARVGYQWNQYLESSLSAGYQLRYYGYFAQQQQPYAEIGLGMKRYYVPVAVNMRLNMTEFFYEKLKLWKKPGRWDVYTQVSLATIRGRDVRDMNAEKSLPAGGAYVPFFRYPYAQVYNRLHIAYVGGLRYNIRSGQGIFIEAGEGLLTNAVLGLSTRF